MSHRSEAVELDGHVVGYTIRLNLAEVEAVLLQPGRPWDKSLGVYRRRSQGRRAIIEKAHDHALLAQLGNPC